MSILRIHDFCSLKNRIVKTLVNFSLLVKYYYDYNVTVLSLAVSNVTTEFSSLLKLAYIWWNSLPSIPMKIQDILVSCDFLLLKINLQFFRATHSHGRLAPGKILFYYIDTFWIRKMHLQWISGIFHIRRTESFGDWSHKR